MKQRWNSKRLWPLACIALAVLASALLAASFALSTADHVGSGQSPGEQTAGAVPAGATVVKVGIRVQSLGPPDTATETLPATFDLWLIAPRPFDASGLVFEGAVAPIRLGEPVTARTVAGQDYGSTT